MTDHIEIMARAVKEYTGTSSLAEAATDLAMARLKQNGYAIVPVEATREMWTAAAEVMPNPTLWMASWKAAIAARPKP